MDSSVIGSDTMSESGTSSDRLELLAVSLGVDSVTELHQDRVRVDRRRLEAMILGEDESLESPETFFQSIMEETNTHIDWPRRLKIGAKSKKDPHVHIIGRYNDVGQAKKKIMAVLDTWSNRVTLKMDVSYVHHSHIIGKGGVSIRKVMEDTGSHIHFPDSNRNSVTEKSNQVSISGSLPGLEKARESIRALTPLVFSFDLPIVGSMQQPPDSNSLYLQEIQERYNVQVKFRTQAKLHGTQVVIKGSEKDVTKVKEATMLLISHMCDVLASQVRIQMSLEVSPQHRSIILGHNCRNLKAIMRNTSTQIMVADDSDPNIPSLHKGNITITGSIHNVYLARQQLLGSLPLVILFELSEDTKFDLEKMEQIMQTMDVSISIRHKPKQKSLSVIIKGVERNASNIYEARRLLLGLSEPQVTAAVPESYNIPNSPPVFSGLTNGCQAGVSHPPFPTLLIPPPSRQPPTPSPPLLTPTLNGGPWLQYGFMPLLNSQAHHQQQQKLLHHLLPPMAPSVNGSSGYGSLSSLNSTWPSAAEGNNYSAVSSTVSSLSTSPVESLHGSPVQTGTPVVEKSLHLGFPDFPDRRAPGCEKKTLEIAAQRAFSQEDREQKILQAYRAMQKQPNPSEIRVPTTAWSGYGFSQSSPVPEVKDNMFQDTQELNLWRSSPARISYEYSSPSSSKRNQLSSSPINSGSYLAPTSTTSPQSSTCQRPTDIVDLLTSLGLERYVGLFRDHEVDLQVFESLTETDLREMGVSAVGARHKMLAAITDLRKRRLQF
ncbi:protein bicaudal C [Anabrus simplex]|uniref:protein bicaudal C n=1 Tax=Anabrus simplex TaxID=316456 RepID=UPI0034DD7F43